MSSSTVNSQIFSIQSGQPEKSEHLNAGDAMIALQHKAAVDMPCVRIDTKLRFDRRDIDRYIDRAKREGI